MKVRCIKETEYFAFTKKGKIQITEDMKLELGKIYTVIGEVTGYKGEKKYVLQEKPKNVRYKKEYFVAIDDEFVKPLKDINIKHLWREDYIW